MKAVSTFNPFVDLAKHTGEPIGRLSETDIGTTYDGDIDPEEALSRLAREFGRFIPVNNNQGSGLTVAAEQTDHSHTASTTTSATSASVDNPSIHKDVGATSAHITADNRRPDEYISPIVQQQFGAPSAHPVPLITQTDSSENPSSPLTEHIEAGPSATSASKTASKGIPPHPADTRKHPLPPPPTSRKLGPTVTLTELNERKKDLKAVKGFDFQVSDDVKKKLSAAGAKIWDFKPREDSGEDMDDQLPTQTFLANGSWHSLCIPCKGTATIARGFMQLPFDVLQDGHFKRFCQTVAPHISPLIPSSEQFNRGLGEIKLAYADLYRAAVLQQKCFPDRFKEKPVPLREWHYQYPLPAFNDLYSGEHVPPSGIADAVNQPLGCKPNQSLIPQIIVDYYNVQFGPLWRCIRQEMITFTSLMTQFGDRKWSPSLNPAIRKSLGTQKETGWTPQPRSIGDDEWDHVLSKAFGPLYGKIDKATDPVTKACRYSSLVYSGQEGTPETAYWKTACTHARTQFSTIFHSAHTKILRRLQIADQIARSTLKPFFDKYYDVADHETDSDEDGSGIVEVDPPFEEIHKIYRAFLAVDEQYDRDLAVTDVPRSEDDEGSDAGIRPRGDDDPWWEDFKPWFWGCLMRLGEFPPRE